MVTSTTHAYARVAGLLYLAIIVCGIFSEAYVRSSLIVPGDAASTAANILTFPSLFRLGFAADSMMVLCDVAVAVLLYALLKPVNPTLSLAAAAFRIVQAALLGFNLLFYYSALLILQEISPDPVFEADQLNRFAMLFLDIHSHGYDLALIFFGFSNIILGYLIVKSAYIPSVFGYGLAAVALVYLAGSFIRFLVPDYSAEILPLYIIPLAAELSFALWLLFKGVRTP